MKQKEDPLKGDWFQTLLSDFTFIKEEINDEHISKLPKDQYRNMIKEKVKNKAFGCYLNLKEKSKKKMKDLNYTKLEIQPYMTNGQFSLKQIKLLFALRSKCYPAKLNFRKMNKGNLMCRLGCYQEESQTHIFEHCEPLRLKLNIQKRIRIALIYGSVDDQKEAITLFEQIDEQRK